jgi:hypothetical protein
VEVILKLNSQDKVTGLGDLLMVAAKAPAVSENGMKLALILLDELRAAVAVANAASATSVETGEGAA